MAGLARFVVGGVALVAMWYLLGGVTDPESLTMVGMVLVSALILFWMF